jgi:predicted nucleotidyltransferase
MYQHHKESLEILIEYFKEREEVIAIVFGGSVAKGMERPDSDLDAMIIVTTEEYERRKESNTLTETIQGKCTYEEGYFDIKYMSKEYIQIAAKKGSEPTRNSFLCAKVLYSKDPEIEEIVNRIPVFQVAEVADKQLSFYSALMLNYHYFWKDCKPDGYMKLHVMAEIIYMVYRMILQENHILFPSNRRLEETVDKLENKPNDIVKLGLKFAESGEDVDCDAFVKIFLEWTSYQAPSDFSQILTRYTQDYETWWIRPRPLVNEW